MRKRKGKVITMSIIRWDPFSVLRGMNNPLEGFDMMPRINSSDFSMDVKEDDDKICVDVSAPGFDAEAFDVIFKNGVLSINGERREEINDEQNGNVYREIRRGAFTRSVYVGEVDEENAVAKYQNGILSMELPKIEKPDVKRIAVNKVDKIPEKEIFDVPIKEIGEEKHGSNR